MELQPILAANDQNTVYHNATAFARARENFVGIILLASSIRSIVRYRRVSRLFPSC